MLVKVSYILPLFTTSVINVEVDKAEDILYEAYDKITDKVADEYPDAWDIQVIKVENTDGKLIGYFDQDEGPYHYERTSNED